MHNHVSVIIPVFNGGYMVEEALQSVWAQSHPPYEVIVVDDGSTDDTAKRVACLACDAPVPTRLVTGPNAGPAAARNRGIAVAGGSVLAFLDADDLWLPRKLEAQMEALAARPSAGYAGCRIRFEQTEPQDWHASLNLEHWKSQPEACIPSTILVRRQLWDQLGGFDPRLRVGEDSDWLVRARAAGAVLAMVPEVHVVKRFHRGNLTRNSGAMTANLLTSLRDSLARRRGET